jgi:hypothetical protein
MSIYNGFLLVVLVFVAHHMSGLNYHFFVCWDSHFCHGWCAWLLLFWNFGKF